MKDTIIQGNCLEVLKTLLDESIDCCVTSPPYWSLRDYQVSDYIWDGNDNCEHTWITHIKKPTGGKGDNANVGSNKNNFANMRDHNIVSNFCSKCGAWKGSLGLEPTFQLYIKHLCDIFDEVKRVLKKEGTLWVNLGDTYSVSGGAGSQYKPNKWERQKKIESDSRHYGGHICKDLLPKSLCQIPPRFAIAMTERGWILRNELIWHKPNCMPSSIKDRFTVDFEKIYFFTKSPKYYFETQYEPLAEATKIRLKHRFNHTKGDIASAVKSTGIRKYQENYKGEKVKGRIKRCVWSIPTKGYSEAHYAVYPEDLVVTPIKAGCPVGGVVLDPFFGSGTTGLVAKKLQRHYLGIELNPTYIEIAKRRIGEFLW